MDEAVIYEVRLFTSNKTIVCPVMENDDVSQQFAFEWAATLARHSHQKVIIYRNGIELITLPAQ